MNNPYILQAIQFKQTDPQDLTIQGSFNKTGYLLGESIHILYSIKNPQQILTTNIEVSLIQMTYIQEDYDSFRFFTITFTKY